LRKLIASKARSTGERGGGLDGDVADDAVEGARVDGGVDAGLDAGVDAGVDAVVGGALVDAEPLDVHAASDNPATTTHLRRISPPSRRCG
jgi:hypothetical protein